MKSRKEKIEKLAFDIFCCFTMLSWGYTAIRIIVLIINYFAK